MSTFTYNKPGIGNVGSYQVSGHPWLTGSQIANGAEEAHQFPYVAKHLLVKVSGSGEVRVHFNSTSSAGDVIGGKHFLTVTGSMPLDIDVRCREVYISNASGGAVNYEIFAELTGIASREMFNLTGSGLTD